MLLRRRMLGAGFAAAAAVLFLSAHRPSRDDQLGQHRNLGKAFYENPTTQKQGLAELQLMAVDYPADTEIFTNEKWKGPPYPEFRQYGVNRRVSRAARDAGLPASPRGWVRDFLLLVDGWAKDADANTAFSQNVEPLPFHGMSSYPYPSGESFPQDLTHKDYRATYNTRPALRLIRPLNP